MPAAPGSAWTDLGRGAAYGALAGAAYGPLFGVVLLLSDNAVVVDALGIACVVALVAGLVGAVLAVAVAAVALALRHRVEPGLGGPLVAGVGWTLPWLLVAPGHLGAAALYYVAPLVLGCLAARRWGTGVAPA